MEGGFVCWKDNFGMLRQIKNSLQDQIFKNQVSGGKGSKLSKVDRSLTFGSCGHVFFKMGRWIIL